MLCAGIQSMHTRVHCAPSLADEAFHGHQAIVLHPIGCDYGYAALPGVAYALLVCDACLPAALVALPSELFGAHQPAAAATMVVGNSVCDSFKSVRRSMQLSVLDVVSRADR